MVTILKGPKTKKEVAVLPKKKKKVKVQEKLVEVMVGKNKLWLVGS